MNQKILLINPISLFPTYAMNQVRTINMIKSLVLYFDVTVLSIYTTENEYNESEKALTTLGAVYIPVKSVKFSSLSFISRFYQVYERLIFFLLGIDKAYTIGKAYEKQIRNVVQANEYKFIISNYWEISSFILRQNISSVKILDTHYAVEENIEVFKENRYFGKSSYFKSRELQKSLYLQENIILSSDIVVSLSKKCFEIFSNKFPLLKHILIPDGNDFGFYSNYPSKPEPNTILFYGSMGSQQNILAFNRFYNIIWPEVLKQVPDAHMIIVGNNPPQSIKELDDNKQIIVTGFVEDVRPLLSKAQLMILPMEIGSGFRGRVVEVMAMGIPVVGTHNALDSVEMETGVHGCISDDNKVLIKYCIQLLNDQEFRLRNSKACRQLAKEKYSIEATFGRFAEYLRDFKIN